MYLSIVVGSFCLPRNCRAAIVKGDSLNIEWSADHHKSSFTVPWLRENCYSTETLDQDAKNMTTTPLTPKSEVPTTEYADMMETDEGLLTALHQIAESGLAVIKNTPCVPGQVKVLAERIAPISHQYVRMLQPLSSISR